MIINLQKKVPIGTSTYSNMGSYIWQNVKKGEIHIPSNTEWIENDVYPDQELLLYENGASFKCIATLLHERIGRELFSWDTKKETGDNFCTIKEALDNLYKYLADNELYGFKHTLEFKSYFIIYIEDGQLCSINTDSLSAMVEHDKDMNNYERVLYGIDHNDKMVEIVYNEVEENTADEAT